MSAKGIKWLSSKEMFQRNIKIFNDVVNGNNFTKIGREFNLSGSRIAQIYQKLLEKKLK